MPSTMETIAIIAVVVVALGIAGMFFGGQTMDSTGGYITNTTNGTFLLGWVGVPVGSFLMDTGKAWIHTAITITYTLVGLGVIALAIFLNK